MSNRRLWYRWRQRGLLAVVALPASLFFLTPVLALIWRVSPELLTTHLLEPATFQAIELSLRTTFTSTLITLILGTPLAYVLARWRFRGRAILDTLIDLPMVLPPAVAGIALLVTFGRDGWIGSYLSQWGITIPFTPLAVVLAQTFVAAPFYIKAATASFMRIDVDLESAAAIDGASPLLVFRYVTLPLASMGLLSGLVMTWARSLGEFGATIIFAGNFPGQTQTMPLAIYLGFELAFNVALTLAVILLVVSFSVLLLIKWGLGQRVWTP